MNQPRAHDLDLPFTGHRHAFSWNGSGKMTATAYLDARSFIEGPLGGVMKRARGIATFVWIAGLALAGPALAAGPDVQTEVDAIFSNSTPTMPGCAVGVERAGEVLFAKGYGAADLESGRPFTSHSAVYMASVSKQLTAMAALLLVEDGKLRLDQPVRSIIPELPAYADKVTVAQLLNHTSGIRDFFTLGELDGLPRSHAWTEADVLRVLGRQQGLSFPPGSAFLYSNSGYVLLAIMVQRVSGQRLDDFARARMFGPIGMTDSRFQHDHTAPIAEKANGYQRGPAGWQVANSQLDVVGDGGLYSTVDDMLKWLAALDHPKVGAKAVALMRAPARLNDGASTDYGMGLSTSAYRGLEVVAHGGTLAGYRTEDWWFPDQKLGLVVLCNNDQANTNRLTGQLAAIFLREQLKPQATPAMTQPGERAHRFAGLYRASTGAYNEFVVRDGQFLLLRPDRPLAQVAPETFVVRDDPNAARIVFAPAADAFELHREGQPTLEAKRVSVTELGGENAAAYVGDFKSPEVSTVIHIKRSPGLTVAIGDNPMQWTPVGAGADRILLPDAGPGAEIAFIRDASGQVSGLRFDFYRARGLKFNKVKL